MDIDSELGTEFDAAGDTASLVNSAQEDAKIAEVQQEGESPTDASDGDELDLTAPQFAYTDENGQEIQLTGQQIIDLFKSQQQGKAEEPQAEPPKEEEKPEVAAELPFQVEQIDYAKVGPDLVSMLSGENGGEEALGPAMAEFQFQTFIQDPRFNQVLNLAVDAILEQRAQKGKEQESFTKFANVSAQDAEIKEFQKNNPWAKSKEMALVGLKAARLESELAALKSGKGDEIKQATAASRKEAELAVIKNLKAKGTLRTIGSKGNQSPAKGDVNDLKTKYDITDPEQRSRAMAEFIMRQRGQG